MPRSPRADEAGGLYHALNRANLGAKAFLKEGDYRAFEKVLHEALQIYQVELYCYQITTTHWHLVLRPLIDGEMGRFLNGSVVRILQELKAIRNCAQRGAPLGDEKRQQRVDPFEFYRYSAKMLSMSGTSWLWALYDQSSTSAWSVTDCTSGVATLVTIEKAKTLSPSWLAKRTSGTVLMPTMSAPSLANMRYSARVS